MIWKWWCRLCDQWALSFVENVSESNSRKRHHKLQKKMRSKGVMAA
jgi:hypothetical protein